MSEETTIASAVVDHGDSPVNEMIRNLPTLWATGAWQAETHQLFAHEAMLYLRVEVGERQGCKYENAMKAYNALIDTFTQVTTGMGYIECGAFEKLHSEHFELAKRFVDAVHESLEKQVALQALHESLHTVE